MQVHQTVCFFFRNVHVSYCKTFRKRGSSFSVRCRNKKYDGIFNDFLSTYLLLDTIKYKEVVREQEERDRRFACQRRKEKIDKIRGRTAIGASHSASAGTTTESSLQLKPYNPLSRRVQTSTSHHIVPCSHLKNNFTREANDELECEVGGFDDINDVHNLP